MQKKKAANGEGSIGQHSDGRWQARISLPDGQRKCLYGRTRQEAARCGKLARHDRDRGLPIISDERLTVEAYLVEWLERKQLDIRPSTHLRYTQLLAHITRAYGRQRLTHLTATN